MRPGKLSRFQLYLLLAAIPLIIISISLRPEGMLAELLFASFIIFACSLLSKLLDLSVKQQNPEVPWRDVLRDALRDPWRVPWRKAWRALCKRVKKRKRKEKEKKKGQTPF